MQANSTLQPCLSDGPISERLPPYLLYNTLLANNKRVQNNILEATKVNLFILQITHNMETISCD